MGTTDDLFDLSGRTAVITGAGSGLGRAAAEALADRGAAVAVVDVDGESAHAVAQAIRDAGGAADPVTCDVSDPGEAGRAFTTAVRLLGQVDVLVANAGIGDRAPAEVMTPEQWDRVIGVNLGGVWAFDQLMGRHLLERDSAGSIINMASIAGLVGITTGNANYAASKGGVIALTRCLAIEWAHAGIRVNAIAPTHFRTPLIRRAIEQRPEVEAYFEGNIPLGRLGEPRDMMGPVVFLASDASAMVTGHVLAVDGGHTAR